MDRFGVWIYLIILSGPTLTALPCENNATLDTTHDGKLCDEPRLPSDNYQFDDPQGGIQLASHTVFTIVVVIGVILLPLTVLARVCWLKKLQKKRHQTLNEVRRMLDQRPDGRREQDIFSIDIDGIPYEDMLGKLPSYDECIANPHIGCPPPYKQQHSSDQGGDQRTDQNTENSEYSGQNTEQNHTIRNTDRRQNTTHLIDEGLPRNQSPGPEVDSPPQYSPSASSIR